MKIYLAGPMSGYPEFNFPAFAYWSEQLREDGHEVFSPAEHDMELVGRDFSKGLKGTWEEADGLGLSYRKCLAADVKWICEEAEGIFMMKGWEHNKGAMAEWTLAKCLGLELMYE